MFMYYSNDSSPKIGSIVNQEIIDTNSINTIKQYATLLG